MALQYCHNIFLAWTDVWQIKSLGQCSRVTLYLSMKIKSHLFTSEMFYCIIKWHNYWQIVLTNFIVSSKEMLLTTCQWRVTVSARISWPSSAHFQAKNHTEEFWREENFCFLIRRSDVLANCWLVNSWTNGKILLLFSCRTCDHQLRNVAY